MKNNMLINLFTLGILLASCGGGVVPALFETPSVAPIHPQPTQAATPISTTPSEGTDTVVLETDAAEGVVSYANDVFPIFDASCNKCHGIDQIKEGLDLTTYDNLMAGSFNGSVITPGDSGNSYLIQLVVEGKMPKRGSKLAAEQIRTLSDWIDQGALNN